MKKYSLYPLVTIISIIIRQFFLPNPFECFGDKAIVLNWLAEAIIHIVAFTLVGLVYRKGSNPGLGSFLYLLTYAFLVGVLWILGLFKFAWWWILIVIIAFIGIVLGIRFLCNKLAEDNYND